MDPLPRGDIDIVAPDFSFTDVALRSFNIAIVGISADLAVRRTDP
jgi:hypothetical protein